MIISLHMNGPYTHHTEQQLHCPQTLHTSSGYATLHGSYATLQVAHPGTPVRHEGMPSATKPPLVAIQLYGRYATDLPHL